MNEAIREAKEIKRLKTAVEKTASRHLRSDYTKAINRKTKELSEYCGYKGISYKKVCEVAGL